MGELLMFRPHGGQKRSTVPQAMPQEARILFFTGVRYQPASEYIPVTQPNDPDGRDSGNPARKRRRRA